MTSFLLRSPVFSPLRVAALRLLTRILASRNLAITSADNIPERSVFYGVLRDTRAKVNMVLQDGEAYSIYSGVIATARIQGAIAEVGVFKGGSARLISIAKGEREFHLFDTFEGLPGVDPRHDPGFREGTFKGSIEGVRAVLGDVPNIHFHKGFFPDTATGFEHLRFSFVHLDVDLYESTRGSLEWFYPRMTPGAMLISHDYTDAEGVRKAFTEFFAERPEVLIELTGTQVAFIRGGGSQ
jgi:O-methyltransferase